MFQYEFTSGSGVRAQRGAILVTSLLLLLVLTIIGVSAMHLTGMQERMAGNTRDINLAFQGAEAALREGEENLGPAALTAPPVPCADPDAACATVYAIGVLPQLQDQPAEWWRNVAREFGADGVPEMAEELAEDPRLVVEELGFVEDNLVEGDPPTGRDFYQVTARSTGGSGNADVILQTTFARRFN